MSFLLVCLVFVLLAIWFWRSLHVTEPERAKTKPIPIGYSIRKHDCYPDIGPEEAIINKAISSRLKPNQVTLWVRYSDWSEGTLDIEPFVCYSEPSEPEIAKQRVIIEQENQRQQNQRQQNYVSESISGCRAYTGMWYPHQTDEQRAIQAARQETRDWKPELYAAAKKKMVDAEKKQVIIRQNGTNNYVAAGY